MLLVNYVNVFESVFESVCYILLLYDWDIGSKSDQMDNISVNVDSKVLQFFMISFIYYKR